MRDCAEREGQAVDGALLLLSLTHRILYITRSIKSDMRVSYDDLMVVFPRVGSAFLHT